MNVIAQPLHGQVRRTIVDWILEGEIRAGANLKEAELAEALGVSRTPLRQALFSLEQEGLLRLVPNRGFFVTELSADEVREIYPVMARLESLALELAGPPDEAELERLDELNASLRRSVSSVDAVQINFEWHETLTRHCSNQYLLKILAETRRRIRRYEYAFYRRGRAEIEKSAALHDAIVRRLRSGGTKQLAAAIGEHWMKDLERIIEFAER